jgi:hypothetical protein
MSGTRFSFREKATTAPASRGPREQDLKGGSQRENRLPETVVTKFLIESGRSLKCQCSGP